MKTKLVSMFTLIAMIGSVFSPLAEAGFSSSGSSSSSGRGSSSSSSSRSFSTPSRPSSSSSSWGSKPSSSSSSSSWGSKPSTAPNKPASSWGSSGSSSSNNSAKWGGSSNYNSNTTAKPASKVEAKRYETAAKSGKAFTTRESAVNDFKSKYGSQYTSRFSSEPSRRPDYIPNSYQGHTVIYNQGMGGYGYWSGGGIGLGTFLLYDALSDAAFLNAQMARQNYYVGPPVYSSGWGFWSVMGTLFGTLVAFVLVVAVFRVTFR